jgi:hypothetical protein
VVPVVYLLLARDHRVVPDRQVAAEREAMS